MTVVSLPVTHERRRPRVHVPSRDRTHGCRPIAAGRGTAAPGDRHRVRSEPGRCRPGQAPRTAAARRRVAVAAVVAVALLVALALPWGGVGRHPVTSDPALARAASGHSAVYVVRPGDTLWSIATRVDPQGDPRPLVARLSAQVGGDTVVPGERLVLP